MTNLLPYFRNPAPKKDREVPREGFRGYVNLYLTYFWQLMFVNLVFLLACIPVVTIPAAFTALNRVCIKLIHDRYTLVWLEFRDEFCRSFGRSFKIGLPFVPVFFLSYYLLSLGMTNGGNPYGMLFSGVGLLVGLVGLAVFQYAFVLNASLDLPAWAILKNSRALTFLGLKYTIGILASWMWLCSSAFPSPWCFWCWGFPLWCSSSCAAWEISPCRSGLWSLIFVSRRKMPECNQKPSGSWAFPVLEGWK